MAKYKSKVLRKCENCGAEKRKPAIGWSCSLRSKKYGKEYDKRAGWAWWCDKPECERAKIVAILRHQDPNISDEVMERMLADIESKKLRMN